tara:strand:- start:1086 stop:1745 length:660 start_codon:yes stop_codon:yes gene_type:complete
MSDNNNDVPIADPVAEPDAEKEPDTETEPDTEADEITPVTEENSKENTESKEVNIDEIPEIKEAYENLYSDLEKSFYNTIILKLENPDEFKKWPEENRDEDKLKKKLQYENEDFNSKKCFYENLDVIFSNAFMEKYLIEMGNQIFTNDFIRYIINTIISNINDELYKKDNKYRLIYFFKDSGASTLDFINYEEKNGKKYGSFINIPTKEITIPLQNYKN